MLEKRNRRIFSQVKSFLSSEKSDARLAEIADAQERFIVAAEANGIPRHELAAALPGIERRNAWVFYAIFLVSLVATLYAAVAPQLGFLGQSGLGLLDYGLPWLFAAALWLRAGLIGGAMARLQSQKQRATPLRMSPFWG